MGPTYPLVIDPLLTRVIPLSHSLLDESLLGVNMRYDIGLGAVSAVSMESFCAHVSSKKWRPDCGKCSTHAHVIIISDIPPAETSICSSDAVAQL